VTRGADAALAAAAASCSARDACAALSAASSVAFSRARSAASLCVPFVKEERKKKKKSATHCLNFVNKWHICKLSYHIKRKFTQNDCTAEMSLPAVATGPAEERPKVYDADVEMGGGRVCGATGPLLPCGLP
jgi:hypothetical protein